MNFRNTVKLLVFGVVCYTIGRIHGLKDGEEFGIRIGRIRQLIEEGYELHEIPDKLSEPDVKDTNTTGELEFTEF